MEMPCKCGCGNWFDLTDGYATKNRESNTLVCNECHDVEVEIEEIEERIAELEEIGNKRREIARLKKQLEKISL